MQGLLTQNIQESAKTSHQYVSTKRFALVVVGGYDQSTAVYLWL